MTKSELIETVANKLKLPKGKAELIVNCVFDSMEASLKRGERIEIRGFGSFEIRNYKAYEGRNPRTGAKVQVRPKRLPFFKVGKELKERVNNGRLGEEGDAVESVPQASPFEAREEPREEAVGAGTSSDESPATPPSEPPDGQTPLF
jgi:integration host factor subunit beta